MFPAFDPSFPAGGFLDAANKELTPRTLSNLNLAQLQVIYNNLHTQIENYNDLLLKYLEERDDLHMEQVRFLNFKIGSVTVVQICLSDSVLLVCVLVSVCVLVCYHCKRSYIN